MKKLIFLIFLLITVMGIQSQLPGAPIDIRHYEFSLSLSDSSDIIMGKAVIDLTILQNTHIISLDLVSLKANGKGMKVLTVSNNDQTLSFEHNNDIITIHLPAINRAGAQQTISISYEGIPADGLVIARNKYGHRGFFADNWPNRARNWLPCVDHPADKAAVDFIVTAPEHYQVVSNGIQVEETSLGLKRKLTHYKETVPLSTKIMVIGVADFAVQYAGAVNCIPVYSWVYPEDREKGFYDYALATDILPFFIQQVGPYAYQKLANVQSTTIFGGMENAGAIFYSEKKSITGTRASEALLAHEIAHQWFGNMATEADWAHLWLSEGFATYMTILYLENKYGQDTARKILAKNRETVIQFAREKLSPVVDTSETDYMELLNANSYEKGGWVLHMLRQQLGDSLFRKSIRTYYARYAGKNATTADLRKVMEEVSGKTFQQFFRQWLYRAGHPQLDISWRYDSTAKNTRISITQKQSELFLFPLEFSVYTEKGIISRTVQVNGKQASLTIPSPSKPRQLIADPGIKLLYEAEINEIR